MSATVPTAPQDMEILCDFSRGGFTNVLFDFDGTISVLRRGWQDVMRPVMLEVICGDTKPTPAIEAEVDAYIDESTGIQTIIQMEHLAEMVRQHGYIAESSILDARGYKAIYNTRLMEPVQRRIDAIVGGEAAVEDWIVNGSPAFLDYASDAGRTLYIFSGTDRADVRNEARILGVAEQFHEIWGALDSVAEYSKEKILREMIETKGLSGEQVLVIGDGPVEIRNAKAFGCVAIGVCSDEEQGHGWDDAKRKRLTAAGADALIPDFAEWATLGPWIFDAESLSR